MARLTRAQVVAKFRRSGANPVRAVSGEGFRFQLKGWVSANTDEALQELTRKQVSDIRVTEPKQVTQGGIAHTGRTEHKPEEVAALLADYAAAPAGDAEEPAAEEDKGGRRRGVKEPAGANGQS